MDDLSEYDDPAAYDAETHEFDPEGPFYLALAQEMGGPVLELGCGTGRFTIPLARAGVAMTGLDVSPGMLARAREKAGDLSIAWVLADARDYALGRRFRLVFESGATFEHMLTRADQLAFLARAREHLEPDGRLLVSLLTPRPDLMTDEEGAYPWFTYANEEGQAVQVSGWQTYDPATQVRTETAIRRWTDATGRAYERRALLRLRLTFAHEFDALLAEAGLEEVARYGDFDRSAWTEESRFLVLIARPAVTVMTNEDDRRSVGAAERADPALEKLLARITPANAQLALNPQNTTPPGSSTPGGAILQWCSRRLSRGHVTRSVSFLEAVASRLTNEMTRQSHQCSSSIHSWGRPRTGSSRTVGVAKARRSAFG